MSSAVAELESALQAMLGLKPPGVSGSRIASLTALCHANVQSESVLIQKIYTHFKKAPGTHKLGVLYVVDSVTRKWTEQAKRAGQTINSAAHDGTYAAGVHRVKELLPVLMNDIILTAPSDQKEKIGKLIEIWEKGQTFPLSMLNNFYEKINTLDGTTKTTTPPGSPPADLSSRLGLSNASNTAPTAVSDTSAILAALANMARQSTAGPTTTPQYQSQDAPFNLPNAQNIPSAQQSASSNHNFLTPFQTPLTAPVPATSYTPQLNGPSNNTPTFSAQTNTFGNIQPVPQTISPPVPQPIAPAAGLDPSVQQQLLLIKALSDQGFSPDKIAGIIAAVGNGGSIPSSQAFIGQNQNPVSQNGQNVWATKPEDSRERDNFEAARSPHRIRRRSRSRSPAGWNTRDSPIRRRDEPSAEHERGSPLPRADDRNRGRSRATEYRQRSPQHLAHSLSPTNQSNTINKWVSHDSTIPKGSIKVLSRTLFVGGVTGTEQELRQLFSRYGHVQTCVVNRDKRHAFVKMVSRADAVTAKDSMEKTRIPESSLRTRWGVGFGPRDCSDYATGVSIIPISKLTDADRKWMLSAEYGGSGGAAIESGMVVEEPDIEIGQGVSSKAISRRMQTDRGGNNGPKSSRDRDNTEQRRNGREPGKDEFGRDLRDDERKDRLPSISGPPSMPAVPPFGMLPPGFPFSLPTQPTGMPMYPPGYNFLGQQSAPTQPPPPGRN
ncbi:BgTH12-01247 [Blumeria graminis f. sp. triticale]|nr:BgTH12-01247 [Blumeria graminis f. sp. triticale]